MMWTPAISIYIIWWGHGMATPNHHYSEVIMGAMASQITSLTTVYSTVYSGVDQRKHQSSPVTGLCAGNSPVPGELPAQMASNAENVSIWWRHHDRTFVKEIHLWIPVAKGLLCRFLVFSLLLSWANCWTIKFPVILDDMCILEWKSFC